MKFFAVIFATILAVVSAASEIDRRTHERVVEGMVAGVVEDISQQMKDQGLDPYQLSNDVNLRLPVTDLLVAKAHIEDLVVRGLSNIVINRINYAILTSRVTFDISLPLITSNIESTSADVTGFGYNAYGDLSGGIEITDIRITGTIRLRISIISGISVREVSVRLAIGSVQSNFSLNILGTDYSARLNTFLGSTLPDIIVKNENDISEVLEYYITQAIEANL